MVKYGLLGILLFYFIGFTTAPYFSSQPLEIPLYHGLTGRCLDPVFVDLNNDGALDVVYELDQVCPLYPVYFRNVGSTDQPFFQRDETMFSFLDNHFFHNMRFYDADGDGDLDLLLVREGEGKQNSLVLLYRNTGTSHTPAWNPNPDTLMVSSVLVTDYYPLPSPGNAPTHVAICGYSFSDWKPILRMYRMESDSLVEIPGYFTLSDSTLLIAGNTPTPTRVEFFRLPPDTARWMILNVRTREMMGMIGYDFAGAVFRNIGSGSQPLWQPVSEFDGEMRLLPARFPQFYWQQKNYNGSSVLGLRYCQLNYQGGSLHWSQPEFWMKGNGSKGDDLAAFDWKENGQPDILLKIYSSWTYSDNFGYGGIDVFSCLSAFSPDSSLSYYPFDVTFPEFMPVVDIAATSFDLADLDGDGDTDMLYSQASGGFMPSRQTIYFNTGSDSFPQWTAQHQLNLMKLYFATLVDLNGDGLKDIVGTVESSPSGEHLIVYWNTGTPESPQFDSPPQELLPLRYAHPAFADLDGDGDFDMVVRFYRNFTDSLAYYRNDSVGDTMVFTRVDSLLPAGLPVGEPLLRDVTGDSLADLLIFTRSGALYFVENTTYLGIEHNSPLPQHFRVMPAYPNPFNSRTAVAVQLAHRAQLQLRVYDIRGRLVRTIFRGERAPGIHNFYWDGKDKSGILVSSGVYLFVVTRGSESRVQKVVFVR